MLTDSPAETFGQNDRPLTEPERRLLQQLTVFAGGFTREAAEAMGVDPQGSPVRDVLDGLVAKSVVLAEQPIDTAARYWVPEPVRQAALEVLESTGESEPARRRHRDFFLALAEQHSPGNGYDDWDGWNQRLAADRENFRLAIEWSFGDETVVDAAPRLVSLLWDQWPTFQEGLDFHYRAVAWGERHPTISPLIYIRVLGEASHYAALDTPHMGLRWAQRAVDLARSLAPANPVALLQALSDLAGTLLLDLDQLEDQAGLAAAVVAEIEALYPTAGPNPFPLRPEAATQAWLASLHTQLALLAGEYSEAHEHALENLRLLETLDASWHSAQERAHIPLGQTCFYLGDYSAARKHVLLANGMGDDTRDFISGTAYTHRWLAYIDLRLGELERAQQYCQGSLQQALKMPDHNVVASCFGLLACLAAAHGQATRAAQLSGAAHTLYAQQGRNPWEDSSLDTLLPDWQTGPERAALAQAYAAGRAMSVEAAAALAGAAKQNSKNTLRSKDDMNSPIQNKIGMVFIPVSNMPAAITWYSRLFGLPADKTSHEGRIYGVPMQGDVHLILDAHRPVTNSSQPVCFFWTGDIQAAEAFLRAEGIMIARPVDDIGGLFTLTFQDPDGNLLMVCQNKASSVVE